MDQINNSIPKLKGQFEKGNILNYIKTEIDTFNID